MLLSRARAVEKIGPFRIVNCPIEVLHNDLPTHIRLTDERNITIELNCYFLDDRGCAAKTSQSNSKTQIGRTVDICNAREDICPLQFRQGAFGGLGCCYCGFYRITGKCGLLSSGKGQDYSEDSEDYRAGGEEVLPIFVNDIADRFDEPRATIGGAIILVVIRIGIVAV